MNSLIIEATEDTPKIILDKSKGLFEMSGRSLPEDAAGFFTPIIKWLENYSKEPNPKTEFILKLEYFNTASSKLLLDTLSKVETINNSKVIWYHYADDEDMQEAGSEFSELVEVPFELRIY